MITLIFVGLSCAAITILSKGLAFPLVDAVKPALVVGGLLSAAYFRPYFRPMLLALSYLVAFSTVYAVLMDATVAGWSQLSDGLLIRLDALLGFDVRNVNTGGLLMKLAYFSFMPQLAYVVWRGDWLFLRRFTMIAFLALAILAIMPARGNYTGAHGLGYVAAHFDNLQNCSLVTWRTSQGILTFPSVHAAVAVLMIIHYWRHWWIAPLNLAMFISTVPVGRHYVVALLAGAALTLVSLAIYETTAHSLAGHSWRGLLCCRAHAGRQAGPA